MGKFKNEALYHFFKGSREQEADVIQFICKILNINEEMICNVSIMEQGMTNHSFIFSCGGEEKYIMRIPGEGTEHLINRGQEAAVYQNIAGKGICDEVIYIDSESGYKLTKFLKAARLCDPSNKEDVRKCMEWLRRFHEKGITVEHEFDLFQQIEMYESLWEGKPSVYKDYAMTKQNVLSLRRYVEEHAGKKVLAHIDAVADNFLFVQGREGEEIRLLDWEYAGMQDPLVDIAMFCIYSSYGKNQIDQVIAAYFPEGCVAQERALIYCYVAICGLLWSNWCEYKRELGIDFGKYSLQQYDYAKEYCGIAWDEIRGASCIQ